MNLLTSLGSFYTSFAYGEWCGRIADHQQHLKGHLFQSKRRGAHGEHG